MENYKIFQKDAKYLNFGKRKKFPQVWKIEKSSAIIYNLEFFQKDGK